MNRIICILLATSMAMLIAYGMPTRALSAREAALVCGLDDENYDCEECYYSTVTMQCSGLWDPNNLCEQVADPPVQGETCDGSCNVIFCSGGGERDFCSTSGNFPFTLCDCTANGQMQCGVKVVVLGSCDEVWEDPGNGQLVFRNCECGKDFHTTQEPCMDADVDYLNTSCPDGGVIVFTYPKDFDRSQLLATIR